MKLGLRKHAKTAATGILVIALGILGVAGGGKTLSLLKTWFTSLIGRDS